MKSASVRASAIVLSIAAAGGAQAGDVKAGRETAHKCEVCHGVDGLAKIVEAPNIAGQNEAYLVRQLNAFKSGERQNEMMAVIAPSLSDKEIADVAAYYAAIEIAVTKIPGG